MGLTKSIQSKIRAALRQIWLYFDLDRRACLERCKRRKKVGVYKNGNDKFKTLWKCEQCGNLVEKSNFNVHHVYPIVENSSEWDSYISLLFCNHKYLKGLCKPCHSRVHGRIL